MKDHVEIGHLTKYDTSSVKWDQVMNLEIRFKIYTNVPPKPSLRSWWYCKRTRKKVLAAEPTSERRSRAENGEWDFSRGFAIRFWRLRRQNFISRAPTIPPDTQATQNHINS